jgi:hypothetical protein
MPGMRDALKSGKERPVTTLLFLDDRAGKDRKVVSFCQFQCYCIRNASIADDDADDLVPAVLATSFAVDKEYQKHTIRATLADGAVVDKKISEFVLSVFVDHIRNVVIRQISARCIILFSANDKLARELYRSISFAEITRRSFNFFGPRNKRDGEYIPMILVLDESLQFV